MPARLTTQDFIRKSNITHKKFYSYEKSVYTNCATKIEIVCPLHGRFWQRASTHMLDRKGCPECGKTRLPPGDFYSGLEKIQAATGNQYTLLTPYTKITTNVYVQCDVCGHVWSTRPKLLLKGTGCRQCSYQAHSNRAVLTLPKRIHAASNGQIEPAGAYRGSNKPMFFRCVDCSLVWRKTPDYVLRGYGCPSCNRTAQESKIERLLRSHGISYKPQFSFDDLKGVGGGLLRFDFAIFNDDGALSHLVEYDGEQHFRPVTFLGGKKAYKRLYEHDRRKNKYCSQRKIALIRIPFKEKKFDLAVIMGERPPTKAPDKIRV